MTQTSGRALPVIPRHFVEHKPWQTALYLSYGMGLYLLPGIAAYFVAQSALPLAAQIPLIAVLTWWAAQGLFMLGVTGHEGYHYTLHKNRFISAGLGMFFSSAVPSLCALGFAVNHWDHHRYTNTEQDPDLFLLTRYRNMFTRLLLARSEANRRYLKLTLDCLRMAPNIKDHTLGMSRRQLRKLAVFNLGTQAVWLTAYGWALWQAPMVALYVVVLPVIVTIAISGVNHYYEHAGTTTHVYGKARTRTAWQHTVLMGGTNYHLEHHLFPMVPCWRLRSLHRWMLKEGHYEGKPTVIEPRFLGSYLSIPTPKTEMGAAHPAA